MRAGDQREKTCGTCLVDENVREEDILGDRHITRIQKSHDSGPSTQIAGPELNTWRSGGRRIRKLGARERVTPDTVSRASVGVLADGNDRVIRNNRERLLRLVR